VAPLASDDSKAAMIWIQGKMRDNPEDMTARLRVKGVRTTLVTLEREDHKDTVPSFGTVGSTLANAVLKMIEEARGS